MSKVDVARIVAVILLLTGFVEIAFMALAVMGVEFSLWNVIKFGGVSFYAAFFALALRECIWLITHGERRPKGGSLAEKIWPSKKNQSGPPFRNPSAWCPPKDPPPQPGKERENG